LSCERRTRRTGWPASRSTITFQPASGQRIWPGSTIGVWSNALPALPRRLASDRVATTRTRRESTSEARHALTARTAIAALRSRSSRDARSENLWRLRRIREGRSRVGIRRILLRCGQRREPLPKVRSVPRDQAGHPGEERVLGIEMRTEPSEDAVEGSEDREQCEVGAADLRVLLADPKPHQDALRTVPSHRLERRRDQERREGDAAQPCSREHRVQRVSEGAQRSVSLSSLPSTRRESAGDPVGGSVGRP